ncbi:tripartite tricarboxylate transporter TctB family protein [Domibacillus indicus]|uniref:tripartite tricarboxylate transporter TctB family protein n=1 Tax=Domibacillus indicus TaxID=1437523 RepID=UPI00203F33EE|nr:tripartite tricarboxylate transporter TctB family protein [Domibacillus indicus]MCM3791196.1 tripartite tricarboxylate transporter TctB family protein [Domibacillus indicus]
MKNLSFYVGLFFLVFAGIIFWQSLSLDYYSEYGPGPGFLPTWTSGIIIVLSLIYLFLAFKKERILFENVLPKGAGLVSLLASMGSLLLFIVIVPYAGFLLSSILTLSLLFSRGYKWYWGLGMSTVVACVVFWVFGSLLGIPLPVNKYGW